MTETGPIDGASDPEIRKTLERAIAAHEEGPEAVALSRASARSAMGFSGLPGALPDIELLEDINDAFAELGAKAEKEAAKEREGIGHGDISAEVVSHYVANAEQSASNASSGWRIEEGKKLTPGEALVLETVKKMSPDSDLMGKRINARIYDEMVRNVGKKNAVASTVIKTARSKIEYVRLK
jgi:hypothetical protein